MKWAFLVVYDRDLAAAGANSGNRRRNLDTKPIDFNMYLL